MKTDERTTTGRDMADEVFWAKDTSGTVIMIDSSGLVGGNVMIASSEFEFALSADQAVWLGQALLKAGCRRRVLDQLQSGQILTVEADELDGAGL
jgi:hypothetical protein